MNGKIWCFWVELIIDWEIIKYKKFNIRVLELKCYFIARMGRLLAWVLYLNYLTKRIVLIPVVIS